MTSRVEYLPEMESLDAANQRAADRGLVALISKGPTGLYRGIAVDPAVAAKMLAARAGRLRATAEGYVVP
jgi:hypothetical protein